MSTSIPGDRSYIGFLFVLLALVWAALSVALLPAFWMSLSALQRRALGEPSIGLTAGAFLVAVACMACFLYAFALVVPDYVHPPYARNNARHDASRDFLAPWGGRMIAVTYGPGHLRLSGVTLWIAETELTRGEYGRIVGRAMAGDAALPVTALAAVQVGEIVERANREATGSAKSPKGRFRLPTSHEAHAYSGDWWISAYPKSVYRCESELSAAASRPENGLGIRGTADNAAEIVLADVDPLQPHHCATLGGVQPHCSAGRSGEWRDKKYLIVRYCTGGDVNKVFGDPLVGVRLVYAMDAPS
jgi:hypothetical protein